jgi:hypothetical protein
MSMESITHSTDSLKKVHHDLGGVLGNFAAFQHLFFSKADLSHQEKYRLTYDALIKRFEESLARLAVLESNFSTKTDPPGSRENEVPLWK